MGTQKQPAARAWWYVTVTVVVTLLYAGCGGGSRYAFDEAYVARSYLAPEAEVPSHPDSLAMVDVREEEHRIYLAFDGSFEQMMRDWSSTWISQSAGRASTAGQSYRSFATLWSLDLSVAALAADEGIEGLSKDLANERIDQRKQEHRQSLQIDLYRFIGSPPTGGGINSTLVGRPGSFIRLEDDQGHTYRPERVENSPPRETTVAGQPVIYRRNTFIFRREVDGRDVLDGVERLRLYINQSSGGRYYFTWTWEDVHDGTTSP